MKKILIFSIILFLSLFINSCAIQTKIIKSLQTARDSILKIETWASLGECNNETISCGEYNLYSTASGAIILYKNKKAILTAAHVCKQVNFELFVATRNGDFHLKAVDRNDKEYIIEIIKYNIHGDICLLRSVSGELESDYIPISTKRPEYAEKSYNLAAPMGIINRDMVPILHGHYFGTLNNDAYYSIPAIGGSSGSPILNSKGELIGIVHSVHAKFHHISLSTTYVQLWNFLKAN